MGWLKPLFRVVLGAVAYVLIIRLGSQDLWNVLFVGVKRVFARA